MRRENELSVCVLRVALEFRPIEFLENVAGGVVEQTLSLGGDPTALSLGGLDEVLLFELLEDRPDHVSRAVGPPVGRDAVAVRATLAAAVLGRESFDADGAAVGNLPQEARGASRPEVLLFGWQFAVDASLAELTPVRFVESAVEVLGERLDEVVRRNVIHRSHWRWISFRGI